jgi:hypothetical protein
MDPMTKRRASLRLGIATWILSACVVLVCAVLYAGDSFGPHYDASPLGPFTGGTLTSDLTLSNVDLIANGAGTTDCVIYDDNGAQGCTRTADEAPNNVVATAQTAWPGATVNTTGADLVLGAGQGRTAITAFTFANCATDTVTVTIDGTATVSTEGTHWTAATSDAATCASLRTRLIAISGISSTTNCSGEELRVHKSNTTASISIACSDATCCTATSGTDGGIRARGYITSDAADLADAGAIRLGSAEVIGWERATPGTDVSMTEQSGSLLINSGSVIMMGVPTYDTTGTGTGRTWAVGFDMYLDPAMDIFFASAGNLSTPDVGLSRNAAGVARINNGSTGYGALAASYYTSSAADPADAGQIRLGGSDTICYENASSEVCVGARAGTAGGVRLTAPNFETSSAYYFGDESVLYDSGTRQLDMTNDAASYSAFRFNFDSSKRSIATTQIVQQQLTCAGGGSATLVTSGLIPDGSFLFSIGTRIATALTGSTGFSVGDGTDADLYGVQAAATQGSTTSNADATASFANPLLAAGEVTLTFAGGNCTAGVVTVHATYLSVTAPQTN